MYGIEFQESDAVVELWGEFDVFSLRELREALGEVSALSRPTLVDLSGVTFLDLQSARELAVQSLLYAHQLAFRNPSAQVMATVEVLGLEGWFNLPPGVGRDEPPVFSEVS